MAMGGAGLGGENWSLSGGEVEEIFLKIFLQV